MCFLKYFFENVNLKEKKSTGYHIIMKNYQACKTGIPVYIQYVISTILHGMAYILSITSLLLVYRNAAKISDYLIKSSSSQVA